MRKDNGGSFERLSSHGTTLLLLQTFWLQNWLLGLLSQAYPYSGEKFLKDSIAVPITVNTIHGDNVCYVDDDDPLGGTSADQEIAFSDQLSASWDSMRVAFQLSVSAEGGLRMQRAASATRLVPSLSQVSGILSPAASTASTLPLNVHSIWSRSFCKKYWVCACVASSPVLHNWSYQAAVILHSSCVMKISWRPLLTPNYAERSSIEIAALKEEYDGQRDELHFMHSLTMKAKFVPLLLLNFHQVKMEQE